MSSIRPDRSVYGRRVRIDRFSLIDGAKKLEEMRSEGGTDPLGKHSPGSHLSVAACERAVASQER